MWVACLILLLASTVQCSPRPARTASKVKGVQSGPGESRDAPKPTEVVCTEYPCLVFEDEFDTLDYTKWGHEITAGGGGNWEFQYYTNNRSNSFVRDGVLYLKPTLTAEKYGEAFLSSGNLAIWGSQPANLCTGPDWWGCERQGTANDYINPGQSARLRSVNKFHIRYGRVEVEARMPTGDWLWPAIWMLPGYDEYGMWPASGEIDIVESRGNADLQDGEGQHMGHRHVGCTMHWGPHEPHNGYDKTSGWKEFATHDFHKYTIDWDAEGIRFFIDDEELMYVDPGEGGFWEFGEFDQILPAKNNPWVGGDKMAPFDKEFFILMNVAVGGTNGYFPDDWVNAGYDKPWSNLSPVGPREFWEGVTDWYPTWNPDVNNGEDAAMQVRYVRVYKLQDD